MNAQQQAFVNAYLTSAKGNGTKAAIAAGYSERTAGVQASQLLKKPEIRDAIERKLQFADLTTQARLERLARIADAKPKVITGSDVINANKLILQVNGALQQHSQASGLTVNIGFIASPTTHTPAFIGATIDATPTVQVMSSQPHVDVLPKVTTSEPESV